MKLYLSQTFFLFQLYKGEDTSFQISGLQNNTDYRFRVYVCRRCQDSTQELCGPLSPSSLFTQRRMELNLPGELNSPETLKPSGMFATDERFAAVLVGAFAALSFLIAFVVEYFFMKWKYEMNVQPAASQEKKKFWETHEHLKYTSYATYCRLIMLYRLSSCLSFSFLSLWCLLACLCIAVSHSFTACGFRSELFGEAKPHYQALRRVARQPVFACFVFCIPLSVRICWEGNVSVFSPHSWPYFVLSECAFVSQPYIQVT